jgi:phosphatidylglycerol:prolipoprotein diacylglycerol transferase
MLADAYLHTLDPFAIQVGDTMGLRWYGLSYVAGFFLAWAIVRWLAARGRARIRPDQVGDIMFVVVLGVLLGGRLGYALFYDPSLFITWSDSFPWWELLAIHRGGMASHGGMIGIVVALLWWSRRHGVSFLHLLDLGTVAGPPGLFLGRLANFVNAELWGRALPAARQINPPWWSVKYPSEIEEWVANGDDRLLELETLRSQVPGDQVFHESIMGGLQSGNQIIVEHVTPLLTAWYPSQVIQAISEGPLLLGAMLLIWLRPKKPGVMAGWFVVTYGCLRVATEFFRQPDVGVSLLAGLSRGQQLSILMVGVGLIIVLLCGRRNVAAISILGRSTGTTLPDQHRRMTSE